VQQIELIEAGLSDYRELWRLQEKLFSEVQNNRDKNYLILTEHNPVITRGKSAKSASLLSSESHLHSIGIDLIAIDRGGDFTFHGPGQLVGYPILNLLNFKKDIHWYLRALEEVIIKTIADYGLDGTRIEGLTGVWVDGKKICAIGVKITRWVTMHGFALNVNTDLKYFHHIIPCGISERGVTSISELTGNIISLKDVSNHLTLNFEKIFSAVTTTVITDQKQ
jgi:lipoyl(octanoyl) transferase